MQQLKVRLRNVKKTLIVTPFMITSVMERAKMAMTISGLVGATLLQIVGTRVSTKRQV